MRKIYYHIVKVISAILLMSGLLGMKLISAAVALVIYYFLSNNIGEWGWLLAVSVGFSAGGLIFMALQQLNPLFEKLEKHAERYNRYPYIEKYGVDYPMPKSEDFGITQEEFNDYNNRFQFDLIKLTFTWGIVIAANCYIISHNKDKLLSLFLFAGAIGMSISFHYIFIFINRNISKKYPSYDKIKKYQDDVAIYFKIQKEKPYYLHYRFEKQNHLK